MTLIPAMSGGGGDGKHTYSTTEHEVATWIDNTKVYEKTIEGSWTVPWNETSKCGLLTGITPLITGIARIIQVTGSGTMQSQPSSCDITVRIQTSGWSFYTACDIVLNAITIVYTKN